MNAPAASPQPIARPRWRRIGWSTWLIALLACGVMVLIEIPGRRTGPATYAHGWPWPYLERDYQLDRNSIFFSFGNLEVAPSSIGDIPDGRLLETNEALDIRELGEKTEIWANTGCDAAVEEQFKPWSFTNVQRRDLLYLVPDLLVSIALLGAAAWSWQRWRSRRRRGWQFSLRTLLIVVPVVAVACGRFVGWRGELRAEAQLHGELARNGPIDRTGTRNDTSATTWQAPVWLPESLAKAVGGGKSFYRVTTLELFGDQATDANLDRLTAFPCLKFLQITDSKCTNLGLNRIGDLRSLTVLVLPDADISNETLTRIAGLKHLAALSINCKRVTARGISKLTELPRLKYLRLANVCDERLLVPLAELPVLEKLVLESAKLPRVHLSGLSKVRNFATEGTGHSFDANSQVKDGSETNLLSLESMPALASVRLWDMTCGQISLKAVPKLCDFELGRCGLTTSLLDHIIGLPTLDSLAISDCEIEGSTRIDVNSHNRLRQLMIAESNSSSHRAFEVHIENLTSLERLDFSGNSSLDDVHFGRLPKLRQLKLSGSPWIRSIDVRGMPQLESLAVTHVGDPDLTDVPDWATRRAHRLQIIGLPLLAHLKTLELQCALLDNAQLSGVAGLHNLESLQLYDVRLGNAAFDCLTSLPRLSSLNVSRNDLDDRALVVAAERLPRGSEFEFTENPVSPAAVQRIHDRRPDINMGAIYPSQKSSEEIQKQIAARSPAIVFSTQHELLGDRDLQLLRSAGGWLRNVNLDKTHLTDAGMATIARLPLLESVEVRDTHISDQGLAELSGLSHLTALNLSRNTITGEGLQHLTSLPHLATLDLSETDASDDALANLRFVPHLERLSLAGTQISDAGLANLKSLPNLKVLDLQATAITDAGLAQLSSLKKLEALRLSGCKIEGVGLKRLKGLPHLAFLDLSAIPTMDSFPECVAMLPQIKVLLLGDDDIPTKEGIASLARMPNLRELTGWFEDDAAMQKALPKVKVWGTSQSPRPTGNDPFPLFDTRNEN